MRLLVGYRLATLTGRTSSSLCGRLHLHCFIVYSSVYCHLLDGSRECIRAHRMSAVNELEWTRFVSDRSFSLPVAPSFPPVVV